MPINTNGNSTGPDVAATDIDRVQVNGTDVYVGDGAFVDLGTDDAADTTSNESGVYFLTSTAMDGVRLRLSSNVGANDAWPDQLVIKPEIDGTVMTTVDISGAAPGDEVDILPDGGLASGSYYTVNLRQSDGSSYGRGRFESASYPYSGPHFDVEGGVYSAGGSTSSSVRYNFTSITALHPQ